MGIFIQLDPVPWEILERVKARILANRRQRGLRSGDASTRKPETQPRRRYNTMDQNYRRPEPAASLPNKSFEFAFAQVAGKIEKPLGVAATGTYFVRSLYAPEESLEITVTLPADLGMTTTSDSDNGQIDGAPTGMVEGDTFWSYALSTANSTTLSAWDDFMLLPVNRKRAIGVLHILAVTESSSFESYFYRSWDYDTDTYTWPGSYYNTSDSTVTVTRITKAFLFHEEGVREITAPGSIQAKYAEWMPAPPHLPRTFRGAPLPGLSRTGAVNGGNLGDDDYQYVTVKRLKFTQDVWQCPLPHLLRLSLIGRPPINLGLPFGIGNHLLRSYGIGPHKPPATGYTSGPVVPYGIDPYTYSVTPSIFNVFGSAGHNAAQNNVAAYRSSYLPTGPSYFIDSRTGQYNKAVPPLADSPLLQGWQPNPGGVGLAAIPGDEAPPWDNSTDVGAYDPIMAWDWGNPTYCREQLLALGFSSSDLTP